MTLTKTPQSFCPALFVGPRRLHWADVLEECTTVILGLFILANALSASLKQDRF